MNRGLTLVGGIGIGAALMYILDPERGTRRRALMRDKLLSAANRTNDAMEATSRDLRNRAQGLLAEMKSRFASEEVPDQVLVERVRSKLGRVTGQTGAIQVSADHGRVTLSGPILASEVDNVLKGVSSVRGVTDVDNRLEVHEQAGNIPSLQGRVTPQPSAG